MEIGSAYPLEKPLTMEVKGAATLSRVCRERSPSTTARFAKPSANVVATILNAVRVALERTPPELSPTSAIAESC